MSNRSYVYVISNVLPVEYLDAISTECNMLRQCQTEKDLSNFGAAIDLFENTQLNETHKARRLEDAYFEERWKQKNEMSLSLSNREYIRDTLIKLLPSIVSYIYGVETLYLFNESYIIKEVDSRLAFRWHTDSEEQLAAVPLNNRDVYFSAWCALNDCNADNGVISFPTDTIVKRLSCLNNNRFLQICSLNNSDESSSLPEDGSHGMVDIEPNENDCGLELEVKAGSIVLFSSTIWHRSGCNLSNSVRMVLYAQYSENVLTTSGIAMSSSLHQSPQTKSNTNYTDKSDVSLLPTIADEVSCAANYINNGMKRQRRSDCDHNLNHNCNEVEPLAFAIPCKIQFIEEVNTPS